MKAALKAEIKKYRGQKPEDREIGATVPIPPITKPQPQGNFLSYAVGVLLAIFTLWVYLYFNPLWWEAFQGVEWAFALNAWIFARMYLPVAFFYGSAKLRLVLVGRQTQERFWRSLHD